MELSSVCVECGIVIATTLLRSNALGNSLPSSDDSGHAWLTKHVCTGIISFIN